MSFGKRTEFILLTIVTVLLTICATLPVSLFSFLCTAGVSAIIGYAATKYHYGYVASLSLVCVAVLFFFAGDVMSAIYTLLPTILCGLSLGICKNLSVSPVKAIVSMSVIKVFSLTATMKLLNFATDDTETFDELLFSTGDVYKEFLSASYGTSVSEAEINAIISESISLIKALMPSVMIIISILFALLCYYLFKRICTARKEDVTMLTPFCEWRAEKSIGIIFLVILIFGRFIPQDTVFHAAFMNVNIVMIFVFFLLGLSLAEYILKKHMQNYYLRKLILFGILIVSLFMAIPAFVLAIFGAIDAVWDFRARFKTR